jgi:hypothetical protein
MLGVKHVVVDSLSEQNRKNIDLASCFGMLLPLDETLLSSK